MIGAFHRRDAHHAVCLPLVLELDAGERPPVWIHDFVLAELLNFLTKKAGSLVARSALSKLEESQGFDLVRLTDEEFALGKNDVFQRIDGLSFVDSMTVAFMRRRGSTEILSLDADFDRVQGIKRINPYGRHSRK